MRPAGPRSVSRPPCPSSAAIAFVANYLGLDSARVIGFHTLVAGASDRLGLLLDALRRSLQVAEIVGVRALIAPAEDNAAASFYRHFGFARSSTDPRHMFLLVEDIRAARGD